MIIETYTVIRNECKGCQMIWKDNQVTREMGTNAKTCPFCGGYTKEVDVQVTHTQGE